MITLLIWLLAQPPPLGMMGSLPLPLELSTVGIGEDDTMRVITVAQVATTSFSHVCVDGVITYKRREPDGDLHLRLEAGGAYVILEVIPQIPLVAPKVGTRIRACGITRIDKAHRTKTYPSGWPELHPVLRLRVLP